MVGRIPTILTIAFLVLVLTPQLVVPAKFPRFTMSPRTKKQLRGFFKDHASDMVDLFPSQQPGGDQITVPASGGGSNNGQGVPPASGSSGAPSQAPATNAGMYIFSFDVGTPPQRVSGALDINSELVWLQCACPDICFPTVATPFYTSLSSSITQAACTSTACQSFVPQTCSAGVTSCFYSYMYGGGRANTTGVLAAEAFTFGDTAVNVIFGCGIATVGDVGGASGVIGLGRGPLSLVSQLQVGRFSYYFAADDAVGTDSFILFGDDATPQTGHVLSAPLLASPAYPNSYFVGLTGIRVDGQDLAIPAGTFDLRTDGTGGVALSITIPVTFLDEGAYKLLKQALVSGIGLQSVDGSALGLELCYTSQSLATAKIPPMALVFDGNAVMELEIGNYFFMDIITGLECLTILPSPAGGGSLLGSLIQTGTHMIYNIQGSKLMFESFKQVSPAPKSSQDTSQPAKSYGQASRPRSSSASLPRNLPMAVINFVLVVVYMFF